jgi:DNA-binding transcriptional MerR regulator
MYTSTAVGNALGFSRETIRIWSKTFAEFLSPAANPGVGQERRFSEDDLRVLAVIFAAKEAGKTYADAKVALASGERAEFPARARAALNADNPVAVITAPTRIATLQAELSAMTARNSELQTRLIDLMSLTAKKDGHIESLEKQLAEAKADIERLNREIGRMSK